MAITATGDIADRAILQMTPQKGEYAKSRARSFLKKQPKRVLADDEIAEIVGALWWGAALLNADPCLAFDQFCVETNNGQFTGEVPASAKNPAGIGAIGDGSYLTYPDWATGILAYWIHLLAWVDRLDLAKRLTDRQADLIDVRLSLVASARKLKGPATTWRSLGGRWAVDGDIPWNRQATRTDKPNYGQKIASRHAQVLATADTEPQETNAMTPTERTTAMIAALVARGRTVIDLRGKLPINDDEDYRYGLVKRGLAGVVHYIQHWTGDAFSRETIRKITGTDYGLDTIPASMSQADEIDMLIWYANYHISKDGGTWGGLAYGTLVFPSGRIYVVWDIGTLTYHAFNENAQSYAICCPASNGQAPTGEQLVSLNHVWYYLCEETPETPAGWLSLFGHTEARAFDARNQTTCPGVALLAHVVKARTTAGPSVAINVSGGTPSGPVGAVAQLLAFANAIEFNQRGGLEWEGIVDLSTPDFGGGVAEPLAKYERLVAHLYNGQPYVMTLGLWDRLRKEGKIKRWPKGDVVPFA